MRTTLLDISRAHTQLFALIATALSELASECGRSPALDRIALLLRSHLRLEEEVLFPAVERVVQDPGFHLTATLRREHQALRALLAEVEYDRAHDNRDGAVGTLREFDAALRIHDEKERRVLYPMAARFLADTTDPELAALLDETHQ